MTHLIADQPETSRVEERNASVLIPKTEFTVFGGAPFLKYHWPDSDALNSTLRNVILDTMKDTPSLQAHDATNIGGWHSERDLQAWASPAITVLLDRIQLIVREMVRATTDNADHRHFEGWEVEAWANVNKYGAFNRSHSHAGGPKMWSGVYYVDPGTPDENGAMTGITKFEDHSGIAKEILSDTDPFSRELAIVPQAGLMVLFPASIKHYVTRYTGREQRITIARISLPIWK